MMEIVDQKGLLFEAANPKQVTSVIDKSAIMPDGRVLVKWTMKAAQALAALGFSNVPSAIAKSYSYPGKDKPMSQQKAMAEFMTLHKKNFNFSDMGTGKTRSVIWAADYLMSIGLVKRCAIFAPLSILNTAWEADIHATAMHRSCGIAVGDPKRRAKIIASGCDFLVINHDGVKSSRLELKRAGFDLIVLDEASAYSNTQTDRWKAMNSLVEDDMYLWLLTGTPAANSPLQAYGLAKLVCPKRVPKFFTGWRDMTMNKVSNFTYLPKINAKTTVFDALQPAMRIDKKDCLDLPPVTFVERQFEMDVQQAKYYAEMKNELLMFAAQKQITAVNSGVLMGKLMQIAAGAVYSDDGSVIDFRATTRMNEMLQVIHECEQKVLVFATYKHNISMIAAFLESKGIECAVLDGDTPKDARQLYINTFQNTQSLRVLVLQPKVAAHGITLTAASAVVWFTPTSSLETWRQANDRINRIGQTCPMTIVKLVGSPIERKVYKVLERRDAEQKDLLDLYRDEMNLT
jgi:SNF2 family DNA or RNA helicase